MFGLNTITSSKYTRKVFHRTPDKIMSSALWKVVGAFLNAN